MKSVLKAFKSIADHCFVAYLLSGIFILAVCLSENFLKVSNITNLLRQSSLYGIVAIGTCTLLLSGNIDVSLGSQVGFAGVILAKLAVEAEIDPYLSMFLTLLVGIGIGAINGLMIITFRIPALVITLGMQGALRGITYLLTDAYPISGIPTQLEFVGRGYVAGIPVPVIIMLVLYILAYILTEHTKTGRFFYSIGGNREAAYLAGISVKREEMKQFLIAGFLAAIVGIILTSRMMSGQPQGGLNYEFDALTACLIAGVSLAGGKGRIVNVLMGAIFIGIMNNIMTLTGMSYYWQQVARSVALLASVLFDKLKNGSKSKI